MFSLRKFARTGHGLQATGEGMDANKHAATLTLGWPGMHRTLSLLSG